MTQLDEIADEVGTSGRTLRRAAARGTIRHTRPSARKLEVPAAEAQYVRTHWPLLSRMVKVLRTHPNVRLAVLFGSVARGHERADSDVDVLVEFDENSVRALALLGERLEEATHRRVQIVELESAEESALLLADILGEGRVLIDRDGKWERLKRRERRIAKLAAEAEERLTNAVEAVLSGFR